MATPSQSILLDLVHAVSGCATSDDEVVATVAYLVNSGKVLLCGTFAGASIDLSAPARATSRSSPYRTLNSFQTVALQTRDDLRLADKP